MSNENNSGENSKDENSAEDFFGEPAKSKDDLNRVDPKATAQIGYALAAIGAVALVFVTINMNPLVLSAVDYLVPVVLLVLGSGIIFYARSQKK